MTRDIDRFWCPTGRSAVLDTYGYLVDPQTEDWWYGQPAEVVTTAELPMVRCLLLLGEPGIGKSTVLEEHAPLLPAGLSCPVVRVDLSRYGEDRLVREIIDGPAVREWQTGVGQLCLVLDGLDEGMLHIPQLASVLAGQLKSWPCDRLWLRIACRTADWPDLLASAVDGAFSDQHRAFELLPLRRRDVADIAEQLAEPGRFLDAIEQSRVVPLACRPLTCRLLVRIFANSGGRLPDSAAELYERGLLALCEEASKTRRASGLHGRIPPSHRLAVAARLAAISIFTGRSTYWAGASTDLIGLDSPTIEELSGGTEPAGDDTVAVTAEAVRETLQTALFVGRGPQLLGWAHATFADYLAARWLEGAGLTDRQVRSLLLAEDDHVYPQARLTAAWLVAMSPDRYRWLAVADVEAFTGEVELPGDTLRAAVVDGLFTAASRLSRQFGQTYGGLVHPGLAEQVRTGLADPDPAKRRLAIRLAGDCLVREVRDELVRLALDTAEIDALRVAAGYAVIDLQADSPGDALVPLVCSADVRGPDPNDELLGVGLLASWPHALDTAAVFEALKRPARANYHGAYLGFLQEFAQGLPSDALPAALAWLRTYADSTDRRLGLVRDAVVRLAARNLPQSLNALVEFAQARAAHHHSLYQEDEFDDHPDPFDDADRRRALVYALIEAGSSDEAPFWLTDSSSANLVRPEDLGWIVDCCAAAVPERRKAWVTLFRLAYRDDDRQHLDLVLNMDRTHPLYESVVADWVEPVPLDSPAADQMRDRWRKLHRGRRRADQPDQITPEIERLLDQFDAGNPDAYWQAVHLLHVRPGTDRYNDEHIPDLTALSRWNQLSQQTRDKLIAAAPRYLRSRLCHPDQWLGQPIMHHPSRAAYQAMVLLLRHGSAALDAISAEDWREWAPAVIAWPVTVNGAQESDKKELIQRALSHSRNELAAALKVHLDGQLGRDELPSIVPEASQLWDTSLADHMEQHLRNGITNPSQQLILTILIRNNLRRARTLLQDWLAAPNISEHPDQAATAAAVLLDHDPDEGLSTFLTLTRDHPQLAQQAILVRDSYTASVVPQGDPDQLADLYIWLIRHFPPAEDPNIEEAHRISRREDTGQWRNAILDRLTNDGDPRTPDAIRRIATQVPSDRWLDQAEAAAQEAVRRAQWTPVAIGQLRRLATEKATTLVRNTAELQHVVVEALNDIQQLLQGANPQAHWLWDTTAQRPKEEDDLSDYLQVQLASLIGGRGVVVNREVQVRRTARRGVGQRVDLHVAAADGSSGRPLVVVVEVKAAWNTELYTAMNSQLTRRYLADVGSRHGIYCVGWYSTEKWNAQTANLPIDRRPAVVAKLNPAEMTRTLRQQADTLRAAGYRVDIVVLDVSYARPDAHEHQHHGTSGGPG